MGIDINVMRRLVAGELTTTGADEEAWLELPYGFSRGESEAQPGFYGWTDAAVAYLRLLEGYERLKTEAATLAQLARDLYDGEDITPEQALNRLHQECMAAVARGVEVDLENRRLKAELEEVRLTLAAEQGRPEGAPSEGWVPNYQSGQFPSYQWRKTFPNGERVTVDYYPVERRWEWCFMDRPNQENFPWVRERFEALARVAMKRVDLTIASKPASAATASPGQPSPSGGA